MYAIMVVDMRENLSTCRHGFRKIYVVFGILTLVAFLSYFGMRNEPEINEGLPFVMQGSDTRNKQLFAPTISPDKGSVSTCDIGVLNDPEDPRFYNVLLEDEALKFSSCQDRKMSASPSNSKVMIMDDGNTSYQIGEIIHVRIDLYDGYGNKKHTGGDMIRASIHDIKDYYHAPGVVTDNLDGSYTVEIKAFWSGPSIIKIMLAYTREVVSAVYRVRTQVLSTRNIYAKFTSYSGKYSEEVLCHPNRTRLLAATNNSELCDLTIDNSDMSFYCVKPKDVHLLCLDWMLTGGKRPYPKLPLTSCEKALIQSQHTVLRQHVTVNISQDTMCRIMPETPCSKNDVTNTWTSREPTGFFTGNKWNFLQCRGISNTLINECMRNKTLYLMGDSTLRQWYWYLLREINCSPITEDWTKEHWHKPAECANEHLGFKVGWYPHSQPFSLGADFDDSRYTRVSIARRIDAIPNDEHAIVVFHLYLHPLAFHYTVTQSRLILIRKTVETFLKRNKHSVVLIKGPHTFQSQNSEAGRLNDCNFGLYTKVHYDTFKGLHDRVVFLNNADTTIALHSTSKHPSANVVSAMVQQLFNFACI